MISDQHSTPGSNQSQKWQKFPVFLTSWPKQSKHFCWELVLIWGIVHSRVSARVGGCAVHILSSSYGSFCSSPIFKEWWVQKDVIFTETSHKAAWNSASLSHIDHQHYQQHLNQWKTPSILSPSQSKPNPPKVDIFWDGVGGSFAGTVLQVQQKGGNSKNDL